MAGSGFLGSSPGLRGLGIRIEEGDRDGARSGLEPDLRLDRRRCRLRRRHVELLEHVPVDPQGRAHRLVAELLAEDLGPDRVVALVDVDLPGDLPLAIQEDASTPAVAAGPERRTKVAHPLLRRPGWVADDDGPVEDRLGGGQVFLQQQRRERQHVADVVEAVTDVVVGEIGGGLEVDADQVADRVVILGPVEPADRDPAVIVRPGAVAVLEYVVDGLGRLLTTVWVSRPRFKAASTRCVSRAVSEIVNVSV